MLCCSYNYSYVTFAMNGHILGWSKKGVGGAEQLELSSMREELWGAVWGAVTR